MFRYESCEKNGVNGWKGVGQLTRKLKPMCTVVSSSGKGKKLANAHLLSKFKELLRVK